MAKRLAGLRQLQTLFSIGVVRNLTDGQLLERFAGETGDSAQAAFSVLVERHGPMVLRVCQSVLDDPHDAQDAFQATFLILLRKARGLWARDSLGPWLFQVARRTALHARAKAARRKKHERLAASLTPECSPMPPDEIGPALHEEIARLPERYRSPVILCDLEGCSHQQAGRHLGLPVGTVKSRLSRGRERLRASLVRRGLAPGAGMVALGPGAPTTLVPPALVESTIRAMIHHSTVKALAGGSAAVLARGVLTAMSINQFLKVAAVVTVLGAGAGGVGRFVPFGAAGEQQQDAPEKANDARTANAPAQPEDQTPPEADGPPSFAAVEPTVLTEQLAVDGFVEAGRSADLYSHVHYPTHIMRLVPEGTLAKKGDFICELDSASLKDELINQTIAVEAARASHLNAKTEREIAETALTEYESAILPTERKALERGTEKLQRKLKSDQAWLDRTSSVQKQAQENVRQIATPSELNALLAIEARIEEARLKIENDEAEIEQIKLKKERLEKYTAFKTIKELRIELERTRSVELAKQATWELEQAKVRKLERDIAGCRMIAPIEGIVLLANDPHYNRVVIEEGAMVRERQKILSVFDIQKTPPQIEVKVREVEVDRVRPGQPVQVAVKFPEGNHWVMGRVLFVAPLADPTLSAEQKVKVYTTKVKLDKPLPSARPGLRAEALIELWKEKTLAVPALAVVRMKGPVARYRVAVKKPDGGLEWRLVTVGKVGSKVVEIKEGLKSGESVLTNPYTLSGNNLSGGLQRAGVWVAKDFPPLTQAPSPPGDQPASPRRKGSRPPGPPQ